MTDWEGVCAIEESPTSSGYRCSTQCMHCQAEARVSQQQQQSPTMGNLPEPPSTADMQLAVHVMRAYAKDVALDHDREALERVATFAEQLAPLMDVLQSALASGAMPDPQRLLAMLG